MKESLRWSLTDEANAVLEVNGYGKKTDRFKIVKRMNEPTILIYGEDYNPVYKEILEQNGFVLKEKQIGRGLKGLVITGKVQASI